MRRSVGVATRDRSLFPMSLFKNEPIHVAVCRGSTLSEASVLDSTLKSLRGIYDIALYYRLFMFPHYVFIMVNAAPKFHSTLTIFGYTPKFWLLCRTAGLVYKSTKA